MVYNGGHEEEAERWAREESERLELEAEQGALILKIWKLEELRLTYEDKGQDDENDAKRWALLKNRQGKPNG